MPYSRVANIEWPSYRRIACSISNEIRLEHGLPMLIFHTTCIRASDVRVVRLITAVTVCTGLPDTITCRGSLWKCHRGKTASWLQMSGWCLCPGEFHILWSLLSLYSWAQIHRYYLKIYPKMCHKIILSQKLWCRKISLSLSYVIS